MTLQTLVLISLLSLTWTTAAAWPCTQMFPSQPPPSTVHSVKPSDVSVFSSIGLHMHSTELMTVVSRLGELLNLFSPDLHLNLDASPCPGRSSLLQQAEDLTLLLGPDDRLNGAWKLVLVFVQVDQLCGCQQQQVDSLIREMVEEVDETLQLLHSQLKRTIVSVALWDGEIQRNKCPCAESEGEVRLQRATLTHALQQSLDELLVQRRFYGRDDFTVSLQDVPLLADRAAVTTRRFVSESEASRHTDRLTVQLWTDLLQPTENNGELIALPCPTEERPFLRTEGNSPSYRHGSAAPTLHPSTGTEMPCEDFSPSAVTPTSVHELKPGDIKVVAAVGDSLTAGNGIASSQTNVLDVLTQYRGLSWSIGGEKNLSTVTTLPNILKYFNQNVTGYSVGKGQQQTPQAFLNQAVAGAKSKDVPSQVRTLVARMKNDSRIDFESDWKVITLFIGGNDVCDHCYNSLLYSADSYARNVRESLDYLHKQVPRALVNLIEPLHITPLREMHLDPTLKCPTWLVDLLCPCVLLPKPDSKALQRVEEINRAYQRVLQDLVESGRYDTRSDFTVVVQPFFREVVVPRLADGRPDRSYFSADCFHLSQRAQTMMARSLWNNMLEPLGNKTSVQNFTASVDLKCPTKDSPFIRTFSNSNYSYTGPSPTPGPIPNWGSDFSCAHLKPSDVVPTSVHQLRPADIKVVAALGDSATAGTGAKAKTLMQLSREFAGVSWSIGGDEALETVTTLPNILRKFNPSLKGFSKGWAARQKGFNMAAPGARTSEIPAQVRALVKAMREHKEVNFQNDWKLVTIFVGGNDLCHYCTDQNNLSPQNYSHNLKLSLDLLREQVPRVLVNVVEVMEIFPLKSVKRNTLGCSLLQRTSCPCVINPSENSPEMEEIKRINHKYQAEVQLLLSGDRYEGKDDFAVVLQPFLHKSFIPYINEGEADASFFSLDCFHISDRAHAEMAVALWNNMLEPVGRKQAFNNFTHDRSKIQCPSEASPFIFTRTNSQPSPPVTTTAPTTDTTAASNSTSSPVEGQGCPPSVPVWVPVVVGVTCSLAGAVLVWFLLSCRRRQKHQRGPKGAEMLRKTGF